MPGPFKLNPGETLGKNERLREDEWEIDFEDTRPFSAERWATAIELHKLSKADAVLVDNVTNHIAFSDYMRATASNEPVLAKSNAIQSIKQVYRPLWTFESLVKECVDPEVIDTSSLWAMIYLNVKLSIKSTEKLRKTNRWITELRRKVDLFNLCLQQCENQNSKGMEMSEMFSPLFGILHESFIYLQRHHADDEFVKYYPSRMEPKIKEFLDSMESTTKHLKSMGMTSRINAAQEVNYMDLTLRDRGEERDGAEKAIFPVLSLPPFRTEHFTGRDREIEKIHEYLSPTEVTRIRHYLIYGRRGIGKTQIALEYCRRYQAQFDAIFWIQCETRASLRQSFADVAVALELDGADKNSHFEENLMKVLGWLRRTRKKWLLVYDNAERAQLLKGYWPMRARGSILLTSRSFHNFFDEEQRNGETVPLFSQEERLESLMARLGSEWRQEHLAEANMMGTVEKAAIDVLLKETGGLPIAINHAATLILNPNIGIQVPDTSAIQISQLFKKSHQDLPPRRTGIRDSLIHSLDTIWDISFGALSENARAILGVLALLSPDAILIDLFFPADPSHLAGKLEFCRIDTGGKSAQRTILTVLNPSSKLQAAIDELVSAAIIQKVGRVINLHRAVQEAVNYREDDDLVHSFEAGVNLLYDAFPKQESGRPLTESWDQCRNWIQHAIHLANKYKVYTQNRTDKDRPLQGLPSADLFIELLKNCAWYLFEIADYDECLNIISIAHSACEDKTSLAFAHLLNTQSTVFYEMHQLGHSRNAIEMAYHIRSTKLDPKHPEIAISLANRGNVEAAEGNLDTALDLFNEAAKIREHIGEAAAIMLALNYLQIGRVWFWKGDREKAYQYYQRSEGVFMKRAGRNRQYTAHLQYEYGNLEFAQGDYQAAGRAYDLCRRINMDFNPLHPLTAAACYKLACNEFEQDHHKRALNFLDKALNIQDIRTNGVVDGTIARIMWKKAEILLDEPVGGRREEAERLRTDAEMRQREIAEELGIDLRLDELEKDQDREKTFDLLVPGYFR